MKKKLSVFITVLLYSLFSFGQIEVDFRFYDSCKDSVVTLDYEISKMDTTIISRKNLAEVRESGAYLVSVAVKRNEMLCYQHFQVIIDESHQSDTLYLSRISLCNSGALHPKDNFYYDCNKKADGVVKEVDKNGVVRVKGKFKNGWPQGKLRYYNDKGDLVNTEIHRNRKLIRIK